VISPGREQRLKVGGQYTIAISPGRAQLKTTSLTNQNKNPPTCPGKESRDPIRRIKIGAK
jgi:hypothetical protein